MSKFIKSSVITSASAPFVTEILERESADLPTTYTPSNQSVLTKITTVGKQWDVLSLVQVALNKQIISVDQVVGVLKNCVKVADPMFIFSLIRYIQDLVAKDLLSKKDLLDILKSCLEEKIGVN